MFPIISSMGCSRGRPTFQVRLLGPLFPRSRISDTHRKLRVTVFSLACEAMVERGEHSRFPRASAKGVAKTCPGEWKLFPCIPRVAWHGFADVPPCIDNCTGR